jgi:MOSC domain-containing protein YiiM
VPEARVVAVNVVYEVRDLVARGPTAIDKRPVAGPVLADRLGFAGDRQCGRGHGGPDKALYAYASEDAAWWAGELALEVHPGLFGENLTTAGLDVCGAHIGEVWQIGGTGAGPVVEVRMPRTPCDNLSARMELPGFHARFAASGRVGALLRVRSPGPVSAGDPVAVVHRPEHGVTVAEWATDRTADRARRLLDSGAPLAGSVRRTATRLVARAPGNGAGW